MIGVTPTLHFRERLSTGRLYNPRSRRLFTCPDPLDHLATESIYDQVCNFTAIWCIYGSQGYILTAECRASQPALAWSHS